MKVYATWSPNPHKVLLALNELGLPHERVEIDLFKGEQRSEAFTRLNPMQMVPVLHDGDLILRESNAILAYLGERHGRLWPSRAEAKALALSWMFMDAQHIAQNVGNLWFFETVAPQVGMPVDEAALERARAGLPRPLAVLERRFGESPWLMGDQFTLADCSLGPDLIALCASRFDWRLFPSVKAYAERVRARPAWRNTHPRW